MFLQKLALSPNASSINVAFTKHITNSLMQRGQPLFQKHIASHRHHQPEIGGFRSSSRHPAGEGNRHRRPSSSPCLPPERCVSSLPWTMGP
jgi:hypothetical protein